MSNTRPGRSGTRSLGRHTYASPTAKGVQFEAPQSPDNKDEGTVMGDEKGRGRAHSSSTEPLVTDSYSGDSQGSPEEMEELANEVRHGAARLDNKAIDA